MFCKMFELDLKSAKAHLEMTRPRLNNFSNFLERDMMMFAMFGLAKQLIHSKFLRKTHELKRAKKLQSNKILLKQVKTVENFILQIFLFKKNHNEIIFMRTISIMMMNQSVKKSLLKESTERIFNSRPLFMLDFNLSIPNLKIHTKKNRQIVHNFSNALIKEI